MIDLDSNPQDVMLEKELLTVLNRHYPGHYWRVECNIRQGCINVFNMLLSGLYGFRLHLQGIYSASQVEHDVMMAGGELLERYRLSRSRMNWDKLLALPTDFAGRLILDKG